MNILITAGPTWVKIDDVRIVTTVFTGATGLRIAKHFQSKGCQVTLLINAHALGDVCVPGITVIQFRYFHELRNALAGILKKQRFDAVIHSAAVSDYITVKPLKGKYPSRKKNMRLNLVPAEKIITMIRARAPSSVLVQFKLEAKRKGLIAAALESMRRNKSDCCVANAYADLKASYKSFLVSCNQEVIECNSKELMSEYLFRLLHAAKTYEKK